MAVGVGCEVGIWQQPPRNQDWREQNIIFTYMDLSESRAFRQFSWLVIKWYQGEELIILFFNDDRTTRDFHTAWFRNEGFKKLNWCSWLKLAMNLYVNKYMCASIHTYKWIHTCTAISRKRLVCTDFPPGTGSKTKAGFPKGNSYIVLAKASYTPN